MKKIYVTSQKGQTEDIYLGSIGGFADARFGGVVARNFQETSGDTILSQMLEEKHFPIITDADVVTMSNIPAEDQKKIQKAVQEGCIHFLHPDFEECFDTQAIFEVIRDCCEKSGNKIPMLKQVADAVSSGKKKIEVVQSFVREGIQKPELAKKLANYSLKTGYIPNEIIIALENSFGSGKWRRDDFESHKDNYIKFTEVEYGRNNFHWMLWRENIPEEYKPVLSGRLITNAPGGLFVIDLAKKRLEHQVIDYPPSLGRFPTPNPSGNLIAHFQSVNQKEALVIAQIGSNDDHFYILPMNSSEVRGFAWNDDKNGCVRTDSACWVFTLGLLRIKRSE